MKSFFIALWLRWVLRVTLCSVGLAILLSSLIVLYIYLQQNVPALSDDVLKALMQLFSFWFPVVLSFTLLVAIFRSLKYVFNKPFHGYELKLLECNSYETIEIIGYGDLIKVWRKWFMLIIWLVVAQIIIVAAFLYLFSSVESLMEWFNIYYLSLFIFIAGYFSFVLLGSRCKRVKVVKC